MVSPSSGCDHHKDAYAAPKHRRERRVRTVEAVERRDEPEQPRNCELALARSDEHTSELQSLMRHSYAVICLKKKNRQIRDPREIGDDHAKLAKRPVNDDQI